MKSKHFPRLIILSVAVFVFSFFFTNSTRAQTNPPTGFTPSVNTSGATLSSCAPGAEDCYTLLEPLPFSEGTPLTSIDTSATGGKGLGGFINFMFEVGIGIAGVLGIVMLIIYGFQYAAEDKNVATFSALKTKITGVVLGLMLLLGIFVILRTINPDLLIVEPNIQSVTFNTGGENLAFTPSPGQVVTQRQSFKSFAASNGIVCPGSGGTAKIPEIAKSMIGKINYSMNSKFSSSGDKYYLDCSSFVETVYLCAGLPSPGSTTKGIFPGTERITPPASSTAINNAALKVGDLIGWMAGGRESNGHVVMYIGNGQAIEVTSGNGGKRGGRAVQIKATNAYGPRLQYVKRIR